MLLVIFFFELYGFLCLAIEEVRLPHHCCCEQAGDRSDTDTLWAKRNDHRFSKMDVLAESEKTCIRVSVICD